MTPSILVCTADGRPQHWAHWQDSVTAKCKGLVAWEYGEHTFTFRGGVSRMTGEQSSITVPSIIGVKTKSKNFFRPKTPALSASNLFRRDRYICAYCGDDCSKDTASMDHIQPTSRGGKHTWTNLVCACKRCNWRKADKTPQEAGLELLYVPYVPTYEESLVLRNRAILADQMEFLSSFLPEHSRARDLPIREYE